MVYSNGLHFNSCCPILNLKVSYTTVLFVLNNLSKSGGKVIEFANFKVTSPVLVIVIFLPKFGMQILIFSRPIFIYFL